MAVCQFFLKGQCKYGDNCRFEHPVNARQSGFGASSWNRTGGGNNDPKLNLPFSAATMSNDLTPHMDKPMWPLSSYAPSKYEPLLIPGLDESPEELRVKAAAAVASGNINSYLEYEGRQIAVADQMFVNARSNIAQAYDQAINQSKLSARLAGVTNAQTTSTSSFGNNTNSALPSTSSAFSNINSTTPAFGQSPPTFGQSAFGQPSFGQPVQNPSISTTSAAPTGAFGQPPNNGTPVSAFGQPLQTPATSSIFGQPSALGQSTSSFIKPASGAFSGFNNTGSTGAFGNNPSPATNAGGTSAGGFSAFATQPSAFSLAAQTAPTAGSAFGQPSFGQPVPATSVPTLPSVFGNPAPAQTSVFGVPSVFGVAPQQSQQQTAPVWPSNNDSFKTSDTMSHPAFAASMPPHTESLRTKSVFKPGSTPYDEQIPPNYKDALPKSVVQAFENQKFEWGDIPEWVPPFEVR